MSRGQKPSRRYFLASTSALPILAFAGHAQALSISGRLPWSPFAGEPPKPVNPLGWYFFTPDEAATVEAIVDRLIPADHLSPGGKDAAAPSSSTASWPALSASPAGSTPKGPSPRAFPPRAIRAT